MTLFEKIHSGEIPAETLFQDELCVAFADVSPQAPVHFLVTPRKAIPRIAESSEDDTALLGHLLAVAKKLAAEQGISKSGYRIIINNGPDGGESVPHLHIHVLGGRKLTWPPG